MPPGHRHSYGAGSPATDRSDTLRAQRLPRPPLPSCVSEWRISLARLIGVGACAATVDGSLLSSQAGMRAVDGTRHGTASAVLPIRDCAHPERRGPRASHRRAGVDDRRRTVGVPPHKPGRRAAARAAARGGATACARPHWRASGSDGLLVQEEHSQRRVARCTGERGRLDPRGATATRSAAATPPCATRRARRRVHRPRDSERGDAPLAPRGLGVAR